MENKKLGIAIIGAGAIAGVHIDAYKRYSQLCEVRAVCDIFVEKAQQLIGLCNLRYRGAPAGFNAEGTSWVQLSEKNKKGNIAVRTAHSLNRVPFIIYDNKETYVIKDADSEKYGLANVAPTVATLLGVEAPDCWEDSMI